MVLGWAVGLAAVHARREIEELAVQCGDAVGLASPSTVHAHLANLERAGLLRRDPTKPRALELVGREKSAQTVVAELPKLPLLGQIAAGGPLLAEENGDRVRAFLDAHTAFAVRPVDEMVRALPARATEFDAAVLVTAEGLLMTPRRTGTDGFFVAIVTRK